MGTTKLNIHDTDNNYLAKVAKVFSHPARVAIIKYISACNSGCICNDLVEEIGLAQPTISQHLSEIKKIGLLNQSAHGKSLSYSINTEKLNACRRLINDFFVKTQVSASR
ncbi:metalloregulator ArsR/SmtB family transcription factor [Lacinutrix sp. C3R15]|uniref:ArsR/SmtB family transcription factor n=1 Tax=Flavobacteriaceae TaxID=49546 RepID=UPI001C08788C|nr:MULTISPECIES: metalloregulator ArsR/SmtB family transcription factor [Flavobacteriaceae]MBU2938280.1 metalloregulator ArsR/SmtB family transcription factor [Lacinutrix sp. C3R15]MDO6621594.1 metalloregulator ArsR/SmtB family transcription factor [Oceanihabitans sp. 1_MG-2023]